MAIKRGLQPTLAEVGKIKIGFKGKEIKSKNGKTFRPPKKTDFFVVTTTERDADKNLIRDKDFMDQLKIEKPKELSIRLPFDSIDKNFFTQYQYYSSSKKVCSGDGENATRKILKTGKEKLPFEDAVKTVDVKEGQKINIKCNPETCPIYQMGKCKVSGILSTFLVGSKDLGGVYKFRTHSYNSVSSILAALEYFKANTGGILQGLPLKLCLIKKTTQEHGTICYASIVIDGEEMRGLRKLAIEESESRKSLGTDIKMIEDAVERSGFFDDHDPEDEIQAEYYYEEPEQETPGLDSENVKEKIENPKEIKPVDVKKNEVSQEDLF